MEVRQEDFDGKPTNYKDALAQKKSQSSKHESARIKHNRNATSGLELPDREKEQSTEDRVAQKLRGDRRTPKYDDTMKAKVIECRRFGHTYSAISKLRGYPSMATLTRWLDEDPAFKESCAAAREDAVRTMVEESIVLLPQITETRGLTYEPLELVAEQVIAQPENKRKDITIDYARLMVQHGRAVSRARQQQVHTALALAERVLPSEYGRDREQGTEVIVIETPGRWLSEAVNATPTQDDGQGKEAQLAISKWKQIRDNAEDTE